VLSDECRSWLYASDLLEAVGVIAGADLAHHILQLDRLGKYEELPYWLDIHEKLHVLIDGSIARQRQ